MTKIHISPEDMPWLVRALDEAAKRSDALSAEERGRAARLATRISEKIPGSREKYSLDLEISRGWKRAVRRGDIRPRRRSTAEKAKT